MSQIATNSPLLNGAAKTIGFRHESAEGSTPFFHKVKAFVKERPLLVVAIITALVGIWMMYDWHKTHK